MTKKTKNGMILRPLGDRRYCSREASWGSRNSDVTATRLKMLLLVLLYSKGE